MSSILLLGNPDHLPPFIEPIPSGHRIQQLDARMLAGSPGDPLGDPLGGIAGLDAIDIVIDLTIDRRLKERLLGALAGRFTSGTVFIVNTLTMTATDAASRLGAGATVIGIAYVPHNYATATLLEAAPAIGVAGDAADRALALLREVTTKEIEMMTDRVALVSARTLAMIINEGAFALMEGVAAAADIDVAMKLGTNYPEGPLRWADAIGPDIILAILEALHDEYGEERYRPCVLLKQMARGKQGFHENSEF